ncbi:MAG: hydrogenase expression/formation protein, partial [Deltaproteobacteria bacterium]|nr:hydrogenase expression/formation protein [Deltaproteobacteria bacterium]
MTLKPGKLPPKLLHRLLTTYAKADPRVIVGPAIGEDAAVIDMGTSYLIATSDPITFATDAIGYYAVVVNANDIATRGGRPKWFLATLLLPEQHTSEALVESIFAQICQACETFGIALIGGHTEITYGLDRPILSGHMLGEVTPADLVTTGGAQVGDLLLLTKGICIEGTSIIAREREADLRRRGVGEECIARAKNFLYEPGISIVQDAQIACSAGRVHAMHDPTEGGLAMAIHEVATAARVGVVVEQAQIPILAEAALLCQAYGLDPLGTIASGALLIAATSENAAAIQRAVRAARITCEVIGRIVPPGEGVVLDTGRER